VRRLLALAVGVALALGPAACGDDETDPGRERLLKAVDRVSTEQQTLHRRVQRYRRIRVARLERKLEELKREGDARAADVKRELTELRRLLKG
jgi:hypothetical protein